MTASYCDQPRRFICGNCYTEFSTLPDLTFHADLCFSTSEHQHQQITVNNFPTVLAKSINSTSSTAISDSRIQDAKRITRNDESAVAVETLALYSLDNSNVILPSEISPNIYLRRSHTRVDDDLFIDQSMGKPNDAEPTSTFRIRDRNVSLAGIRVTAGLADIDRSEPSGEGPDSEHSAEYRGLAGRSTRRPRSKKAKKISAVENALDYPQESFDGSVESRGQEIDMEVDIGEKTLDSGRLDGNQVTVAHSMDSSKRTYPQKPAAYVPRQKWRYLPAEAQDLRLSDGRMKRSYRIHCPVCDLVLWRQNLHQHMRSHNGQRPYNCQHCPKTFVGSSDLKKHLVTHQDPNRRLAYHCPFCTWTGFSNLRRHVRMKHEGAEFDPDTVITRVQPPKKKDVVPSVDMGVVDSDVQSKAASVVEEVFRAVMNGTFHLSDDDLWESALEQAEVQLQKDPKEILRTWSMPRIECNICWRVVRRSNFADHRRIHEGSKPFQCTVCSRTFRHRKWLRHHLDEHTGEKSQYSCGDCGKKLLTSSGLTCHQNGHCPVKENPPAENSKTALPWRKRKSICHVCGHMINQARMPAHLKEHEEGVKVSSCDQCSNSYRSSYSLRMHKAKVHDGKQLFKCLKCDYSTSTRQPLVDHMLEVHQETVDRSVVLIRGITTIKAMPTRKCPICDVRIFLDTYSDHQKKHADPEEYERLRREKEVAFQLHVREQRSNRTGKQNSFQNTARRILKSIRRKGKKLNRGDHDYVAKAAEANGHVEMAPNSGRTSGNVSNSIEDGSSNDEHTIPQQESASPDPEYDPNATVRRSSRITKRTQRYGDIQDVSRDSCDSNVQPSNVSPESSSKSDDIAPKMIRYQCLMCNVGFTDISDLIAHDRDHQI